MSRPARNVAGQFASRQCPDPRCGGTLQPNGDETWRCNGLTHLTDDGPLIACRVSLNPHYDRIAA